MHPMQNVTERIKMKLYVGVTDSTWYNYLAHIKPDEVNFWQPGGKQTFKALGSNDMFLFKLHSPLNYIAGGGFFVRHSFLPVSLAWEAFGDKNGRADYQSFYSAIHKYRKSDRKTEPDPVIGCIILTSPFFFAQSDWIPIPEDWQPNIVQGKSYDTDTIVGQRLYQKVTERIGQLVPFRAGATYQWAENQCRYGVAQTVYPRIGQGAFKVLVTEAYHRRCAVSGEKTLPVLEAAHIRPYSLDGPHATNNGLLLRKDLHTLFDRGYITVDKDLHVLVSKRIKEDYGNGREYYAFHGKELVGVPDKLVERPSPDFLQWHNESVYLG